MRSLNLLSLLATTAPFCFADVEFTIPAAGAKVPAGAISIKWKDSGSSPSLSDLKTYQIDLMAGGNTDANSDVIVNLIPPNTQFSGNAAQGVVQATLGGESKNAYYLRITSVASEGGQVINFSPHFTISGMTGTFSAKIQAGLPVKDATARDTVNQVANNPAGGAADGFNVPYNEQTGLTRMAPMMVQPPTSITKKNTTPLFPTSSVSIATTFLPVATVATTITQSNTHSVSQMENTASALAGPAGDMQKFLNRWKD
ncbi:hypothetical protein NA57DRAFT_46736 [Rhizodiscina lignyota]|uniref:Uncharacterized protein n=1 Tax=Rhizodiscina lignyota TaxID=1504668 RepID=A0A9P4I8F1_9PEZI|nr:hypothetical protein NA57DRAFT_46736 [Rhizodiscina lignyota]